METEEDIPGFIKKFYEKKSNLGKTLPASTIKHTKTIGGIKHHYLKLDNEEGDWLNEDFFKIITEYGEIVETIIPDCNTRKSRDKRVKRHTLGILIGASPCGIVRMCEELFGSEGVSQVYGICCEYLSNLSFRNLKVLVYDDVCHLVAFALKQKVRHQSATTEFFSQLKFAIDRFHFRNHVDQHCHENYNPKNVEELKSVNTVVCEELFTLINQYKNCRSMNQAHFFMFHFYNLDLHNLNIEGFANTLTNTHNDFRASKYKEDDIDFDSLKKVEDHIETVNELTFKCLHCSCAYDTNVTLKKHIKLKHQETSEENPFQCCKCSKVLSSSQRLNTHMKTCCTCNVCKEIFDSITDMLHHKKIHTSCTVCNTDYGSKSKLQRHMTNVHK